MKKSFFAMAAILGLALTSCSSDDNNKSDENKSTFVLKVDDLKGNINDGTVTLDPTQTYTLTGGLVVKGGATLIIPAGTTIKASATADPTSLFIAVERNAKINVNGTAAKPVIMTSAKAVPTEGSWGGLIIAGNAKVNTGDNGTSEVGSLSYGGTNNTDSSGNINFLKISYTGSKFSTTKEYNGVSFFGVGSGTVVSDIYTYESGDDGIEFFGGTVNATNLVIVNSYDDSFDFADGWQGSATNVYIKGVSKAAIEGSNNEKSPGEATPVTTGKLVNFSIIKGGATFLADEKTINFKDGGGKQAYTNFYVDNDMPSALIKISSTDAAAAKNIADGFFTIENYSFGAAMTNTTGPKLSGTVGAATGAGAGAELPSWANWTK
ncbi:hypothetical protein PQ462_21780 [Flavobacterium sp. KACC 22758]|uniref:hypothetical protein n=1 Tax=Flavobacterium sp. KACC 22758 TaxID=3025667 RepID=UPI002365635E|nr:hypothetical protein [Flavobacterium sp. KACC 22758]WDF59327.1 hypothetical protein PQ462_21780 [Flavobacterium sp. KACC 22758]